MLGFSSTFFSSPLSQINSNVNLSLNSNQTILKSNTRNCQDSENVLSYTNILKTYYNLAIGTTTEPSKTFAEFYNEYYAENSDRNLYKFTLDLANENNNLDTIYSALYGNEKSISLLNSSSGGYGSGGSSSNDADYILYTSINYSSTPSSAFARNPYRSIYDYSSVKSGDIIWETETIFFNAGHSALIVDTNHDSDLGSYIQTIESVGGGVQRGFLDDLRMTQYKCKILRVKRRNNSNVNKAIYLATSQIGKSYSLNTLRLNTNINSNEWYCSELVYVSWKYAGIDIGVKDGKYLIFGCLPADIGNSDNTYVISMPYFDFLNLEIVSKNWWTWTIRIINTSSVDLDINYNSKMCDYNDAKNWINLKDIELIELAKHSSVEVKISENFFVTSIVASYTKRDYRIISYADNLNANVKSMEKDLGIFKTIGASKYSIIFIVMSQAILISLFELILSLFSISIVSAIINSKCYISLLSINYPVVGWMIVILMISALFISLFSSKKAITKRPINVISNK